MNRARRPTWRREACRPRLCQTRGGPRPILGTRLASAGVDAQTFRLAGPARAARSCACLLYTSDAADDM
eukprot:13759646-Alexandrium_andersonii.AAC.1